MVYRTWKFVTYGQLICGCPKCPYYMPFLKKNCGQRYNYIMPNMEIYQIDVNTLINVRKFKLFD